MRGCVAHVWTSRVASSRADARRGARARHGSCVRAARCALPRCHPSAAPPHAPTNTRVPHAYRACARRRVSAACARLRRQEWQQGPAETPESPPSRCSQLPPRSGAALSPCAQRACVRCQRDSGALLRVRCQPPEQRTRLIGAHTRARSAPARAAPVCSRAAWARRADARRQPRTPSVCASATAAAGGAYVATLRRSPATPSPAQGAARSCSIMAAGMAPPQEPSALRREPDARGTTHPFVSTIFLVPQRARGSGGPAPRRTREAHGSGGGE
jgi:hypothetical protein